MPNLTTHTAKDPSTRHATTEYNRHKRVVGRVTDLYARLECYHMTHDAFLVEWKAIHESADYRKLSSYYKGYIAGMSQVLRDRLYSGPNAPLMWTLTGTDGQFYPEGNDDWLQRDTEYKSGMNGRHIWRKPFVERGEVRYF